MCFNSSIVVQFRTLCEEQSVQKLVSMLRVSGGHPSSGVTVESEVAPEGWRAGGLCVLVCVYVCLGQYAKRLRDQNSKSFFQFTEKQRARDRSRQEKRKELTL